MAEDLQKPAAAAVAGHEIRDVNARAIGCFALALIVSGAIVAALIAVMFIGLNERHPGSAANRIAASRPQMPEPQLQSDPAGDMEKFRAREDAILNSYGWVDRDASIVRIPIERAMEIVAQRGLPAPPDSTGKTPIEMRQEKAKESTP